ncbi:MAG: DegT/DnrJ/EryC1/StrS family aminotransferase [Armatimonadetes bacterium]|nr:DegT/DnrJ/EryC1/StrS family aminotransferase [Armatimonadota bacterium]
MADLRAQYQSVKEEVDRAVLDVLATAQFVLGDRVARFESRIAAVCGAAHGVGVASGTDALLLPLVAMGIGPGDEVIVPSFTFVATAEVVCLAGAAPVFAEIRPDTFNLDPEAVAAKITPRTRAILPVHLYGQMADMGALREIADRHGLRIIEDAAQAIGAEQRGRRIGQAGDAAGLSFFPTKNLGAAGDGGMVLTNDAALAERLRNLRFHGSGGTYYYANIGYNSRLDALQAAILEAKLGSLDRWNEARRANAAYYRQALAGTPLLLPVEADGNRHIYHQYTLRVPEGVDREALRAHLQKRGIASAVYYPLSVHLQEAYARFGEGPGSLPETERAQRQVLSLPVYPELTAEQREHVAAGVRSFFTGRETA